MKKYLLCASAIVTIALAGCGGGSKSNTVYDGALSFNNSKYQVTADSVTDVELTLSNSQNHNGQLITISSSNTAVASIINNTCTLSDESGFPNTCTVRVKGNSTGNAIITASASGIAPTTSNISVSTDIVAGTLSFKPSIEAITQGSDKRVKLTLNGSSGVDNLQVNLTSSNSAIANPVHSTCILGSLENTCNIIIDGNSVGNAVITATAPGYTSITNNVTVISDIIPGTLSFEANKQIQVGDSEEMILSLANSSGVNNLAVTITTQNSDATISTSSCTLSSSRPDCHIQATGKTVGSDTITATATGYSNANALINVINTPIKGSFNFVKSTESIDVSGSTTVDLVYTGGSGVQNLPVSLKTSNGNATISPSTCTMGSTSHDISVCTITITGVTQGQTIITASANGYSNVTNTVNVLPSGTVVPGNLVMTPNNQNVAFGNHAQYNLSLKNSLNVKNIVVQLASSNTNIASLKESSCALSSANNTCNITVNAGQESGTAVLTASSSGYTAAKSTVTVTAKALPYLVFIPSSKVLSSSSDTAVNVTLELLNAPIESVAVCLNGSYTISNGSSCSYTAESTPVKVDNAFSTNKGYCSFSASNPLCVFQINNVNIGYVSNESPTYISVGVPAGSGIKPPILTVRVENPTPQNRTITVKNNCPITVYAGISGGATAAASTCPNGSTISSSDGKCYWNNPVPSNNEYKLIPNASTSFTIQSLGQDAGGAIWSGGVSARILKDGKWIIGNCSQITNSTSGACDATKGFDNPQSTAEFTLLANSADTYDITLINGVVVPISMKVKNGVVDPANPYTNGTAGDVSAKSGTQYSLLASTWSFSPPTSTITAYTSTDSNTYYNYVSGSVTTGTSCSQDSTCPSNQVCGYPDDAIRTGSTTPNYARICGYRLGYLTPAALAALNPNANNTAPFGFNQTLYPGPKSASTPYPNLNNSPLMSFYQCNGLQESSGYQPQTVYPNACGCVNWASNIATPTSQCVGTESTSYTSTTTGIGFNTAWIKEVLPRITWVKQGCPTCYSYQFDDMSSTFTGFATVNNNPANGANYTITFCPGGKYLPNYDPSLPTN
jgi:hypothetical protein